MSRHCNNTATCYSQSPNDLFDNYGVCTFFSRNDDDYRYFSTKPCLYEKTSEITVCGSTDTCGTHCNFCSNPS